MLVEDIKIGRCGLCCYVPLVIFDMGGEKASLGLGGAWGTRLCPLRETGRYAR